MDEVAAKSGSDAVGFIFLRANGRDELNVSDVLESVLRDFGFVEEKYSVRAINTSADTLCLSAEFICSCFGPNFFVFGVSQQLTIFE